MKILDKDLLKQGKVEEAILVHSYAEYQVKGGQRDIGLLCSLQGESQGV